MGIKSIGDLMVFRAEAIKEFGAFPLGCKLDGMDRALTDGEAVALSYYEAALMLLNAKGAIKEGWLEANRLPLIEPASNPAHEDYE